MADFLLSVGVDVGLSYTQMRKDISTLVSRLNSKPVKIKVGLDVDNAEINKLREQLSALSGLNVGSKQNPVSGIAAQVKTVSAAVSTANKNLGATEARLNVIKATLAEIQRTNTKINSEYARLKSSLGGETATGKNADDVALMKQKYIEYQAAVEAVRSAKAAATQEDIVNVYRLQAAMQTVLMTIDERIQREEEATRAAEEAAQAKIAAEQEAQKASEAAAAQQKKDSTERIRLLNRTYKLLKQMQHAEETWTMAKTGKSAGAYDSIVKDIQSLSDAEKSFRSGKMSVEEYSQVLTDVGLRFNNNSKEIAKFGENTQTLSQRIGGLAKKFSTWFGVSQIIMFAYRSIRKMISAVTELDTAMTELKKVTNETDATYAEFLDNATGRAKTLGATLSDVVTATADFARLGYGLDDASTLADAAIIYKNVGDGINDINTASESIIATMQAYGIEASRVMTIVDKFNEIGNNFAITSKGVGDALLRSAAAMEAANNTLDETIALIAAANTIVQDPDKVGTTLKTVSMYLRAAKTEAEDAGESTDGMASSVSELRNELLSLTNNRVDIQIDENTFKSTYQILKELSVVWGDLSDITQANILELVGGKRNSNVVAALLENFSVAEESLEASANAAGSALRENEKHLDSIQGKISLFKSAFEDLSNTLFDSELIKFFVDFGTTALNVLNGLIEQMGSLGTAAAATAIILNRKLGVFGAGANGKMQFDFKSTPYTISEDTKGIFEAFDIMQNEEGLNLNPQQMWEFADGLEGANDNLKDFLQSQKTGAKTLDNFNKYMKKQSSGLRGLGKSFKKVIQSIAIDIVIINTMRAISDLIGLLSKLGDKETEVFEEFDSLSSELSSVESELSSLESELASVESQIDALLEKGELTFADQEELSRLKNISRELKHQISLSEALEESLKKSVSGTALEAYSTYANSTSFYSKQSAAERKEEAQAMGSSIGNVAGSIIGGIIGTMAGGNTVLGAAIGSSVGSLGGGLAGGAISDASYANEITVGEMLDKMRVERAKLTKAQEEAYEKYTDHRSNANKEEWENASAALNDYNTALANHISQLQNYYNAVDYATLTTEKQREEYRKMGDDLDAYNIQMGVAGAKTVAFDRIFDEEQITDEALEMKQAVQAAINAGDDVRFYDFDSEQFTEMKQRLADMGLTLTDVITYFKDLKEAEVEASDYETYDMVENIASLSVGVSQLVDAFEEFNEQGMLTAETLVKLNALFGNLGDKWTNYVDAMTSGTASMSEAANVTQELAEGYLNKLLENGGIQLNKYNESTGEWELDADKYETYLATINELEVIGVENAKEYVDALQQQAMIQATVNKMIADASDKETLLAKKKLTQTEQDHLAELQSKTVDDYIRETENLYGIKIEDTSLIQQQKNLEDTQKLANDFEKYLSNMKGSLDEYESSIQRHNDLSEDYAEVYAKYQTLRDEGYYSGGAGSDPWGEAWEAIKEGFTFTLADTKYDEYDRLVEDLNGYSELFDEEAEERQDLFDELVSIAKKANIDLSSIDVESFDPYIYGDGSIFNQVYYKVLSELENADYESLSQEMATEIEEQLNGLGLNVDLDLNIDSIVIDKLKSSYGLLETAEAEMNAGTGLSVDTIQALAEETDDYLDYLYEENGLIKLNTDLWKERANLEVDDGLNVLRDEIDALKDERDEIEENLEAAKEEGDTAAVEEYTAELEENTAEIERNEHELQILTAIYDSYTDSVDTATAAQNEFATALSGVQSMQSGFDQLDAIYADVLDKENFDWGSILNNQQFADTFGDLGDVYLDFISTVSNSPDDIDACQEAFNDLTTAYLMQSDVLTGVTDATRNATVKMLEQMGVANAAAIVDRQLAYNKEYLRLTTGDFADMEYAEIMALYAECEAGSVTQQVLAQLAAEKFKCNENGIKTSSDIDQLIALANSANATTATLTRLAQAKELLGKAEAAQAKADSGGFWNQLTYGNLAKMYNAQAQALINQKLEYEEIDSSQFKVDYTGGNQTSSVRDKGGSGDTEKEETWFEKQYKLHKHLVAMEQETEADYLKWLNSAYQKAYDEGILELDEYYRYQEEVFEGLRNLFKDYLNDVEHEIAMRENYEGESDKIIELYKGLMVKVEKEIADARAQGLDDTDDYIQELQTKWQDYSKSIKDIEENAVDSAKDAIDELVDYRIDMIKQDIEDEKDALDKKLDYLKEFYDKQKEMLQDQYDEEKYLEEQAEKRKSVSDLQSEIAMLENDDSAWAQKRKLELQEELATAQDDLGEFEDEHALDLALDALDNAYNEQEARIQAEMDALDEKLNDPEALFNQALAEIKNNTGNLYQEMLEFNRKYGTGNDEDVKDIYEEAYKALLEYKDIYGEDYEGVILTNATDYKPETGTWDTEPISGTNPDNKQPTTPTAPPKEETTTSAPSLSKGSTITVKKSATHFGSKSNGVRMASFVPGGSYTVYQTSGDQVLIGRNGVYTGWIKKSDIVGYATGTESATPGLHRLDELGSEYLFTSKDGNKYRVLSNGDKVLNTKATEFLYEFANGGGEILEKIIKSAFGTSLFDRIQPVVNHNDIDMGDIIVQGNADNRTVSEIRRAQRDNLTEMLKSLNKLNK